MSNPWVSLVFDTLLAPASSCSRSYAILQSHCHPSVFFGQEVGVVESLYKILMSSFRAIIKLITEAFYMDRNIKK